MFHKVRVIVSFMGARSRVFEKYVTQVALVWLRDLEKLSRQDKDSAEVRVIFLSSVWPKRRELLDMEITGLTELEELIKKAETEVYEEALRPKTNKKGESK